MAPLSDQADCNELTLSLTVGKSHQMRQLPTGANRILNEQNFLVRQKSTIYALNIVSTPTVDPRFGDLWDRAADALGTAAIFQRRAERYERMIRVLTFVGLVLPIIIGGIVLGGLADQDLLKKCIFAASAL